MAGRHKYGGWTFEIDRGDEGNQFKLDETMSSVALLLGRRAYEGFAAAWPECDGEFARAPAHVVFPVVLGTGKRLFGETTEKKRLQLSSSTVVGDGVAIQVYTRT